ncbi:hypothetical protein BH11PAT4_BH11PAT4_7730 [soil metagenome]
MEKMAVRVPDNHRRETVRLLIEGGFVKIEGTKTLVSGRKAPVYIDLRALASNPVAFGGIAAYLRCMVNQLDVASVMGIPHAADQLALGVGMQRAPHIPVIRIDKPGDTSTDPIVYDARDPETSLRGVALIDDVISDGGSKIRPITYLTSCGYVVKAMVVVVDRLEGGAAMLQSRFGISTYSLCSIDDIMEALREAGKVSAEMEEAFTAYRQKYG